MVDIGVVDGARDVAAVNPDAVADEVVVVRG